MRTRQAWLWTALGIGLLAGAVWGDAPAGASFSSQPELSEPSLEEAQAVAAHLAAGDAAEDASRLSRAKSAHWAPVVRGQLGGAQSDHTRDGVLYQEALHWTDLGTTNNWAVSLTWDLPSAIYARDEHQLALSAVHLARVRREVSLKVAQLYLTRQRRLLALRSLGAVTPQAQLEGLLALLETTADLDALTGGLFRPALERIQTRATALEKSLHLEELP